MRHAGRHQRCSCRRRSANSHGVACWALPAHTRVGRVLAAEFGKQDADQQMETRRPKDARRHARRDRVKDTDDGGRGRDDEHAVDFDTETCAGERRLAVLRVALPRLALWRSRRRARTMAKMSWSRRSSVVIWCAPMSRYRCEFEGGVVERVSVRATGGSGIG